MSGDKIPCSRCSEDIYENGCGLCELCYTEKEFRDKAALAALTGILATNHPCVDQSLPGAARGAFDFADAMVAERRKRDEG